MARNKGARHAANILGALRDAARPLGAYELLDRLRPTGVAAPLTVYRALDTLLASGDVHRIESLNAFVACTGRHRHGPEDAQGPERTVGFAICDACGSVDEFVDPKLSLQILHAVAERRFVPRASTLEVHGLCAACKASG